MSLFAENIRIGLTEFGFIEGFTELAASFLHLLVDFFFNLGEIILNENICTISLLGILIIDKRVVECGYVTGCNPGFRMHEYAGVYTHNILVEAGHRIPPVLLDIVFEFNTKLAVIIHCGESVIDFTGRENITVFLTVGDKHLEQFFLCHIPINYISFYKACKVSDFQRIFPSADA